MSIGTGTSGWVNPTTTNIPTQSVCPGCGRCDKCGRGLYTAPYPPYYWPYSQPVWINPYQITC